MQVAEQLGDQIKILKVDTDENPDLSNQLRVRHSLCAIATCTCIGRSAVQGIDSFKLAVQIEGLPTMVFVGTDPAKPAIRTEGLLPAETIVTIINDELTNLQNAQQGAQPAQ